MFARHLTAIILSLSISLGAFVSVANAQQITLAQLIELFIAFDIISPDKATQAREILKVYGTQGTGSPSTTPQGGINSSCPSITLTRNLGPGQSHAQVTLLQQFLKEFPQWYPEGQVTGYYGTLTQRAVERYQIDKQLVWSGTPATTGFGFVGPKTRSTLQNCHVTGGHPAQADTPTRVLSLANILAGATFKGVMYEAKEEDEYQTPFFRTYGKTNVNTFSMYPDFVNSVREVMPSFTIFSMSDAELNRAVQESRNTTFFILSGCMPSSCAKSLHAAVYDFATKKVAVVREKEVASSTVEYHLYGSPSAKGLEVLLTAFKRSLDKRAGGSVTGGGTTGTSGIPSLPGAPPTIPSTDGGSTGGTTGGTTGSTSGGTTGSTTGGSTSGIQGPPSVPPPPPTF